jgi:membrane associated rhomboid family serine protease
MSYFKQYRPTSSNRMPFVVLNLIILNVIFYVAKILAFNSQRLDLTDILGLYHPLNQNFHWYQFATSMFMHASPSHIIFNMLGVWMFGHMLENVWGARRFLIYYLVCGLGASLIYLGWETYSAVQMLNQYGDGWALIQEYPPPVPMVGASGAVYGLLMGAALLFPNTEMHMMFMMGYPIKLKWLAIIYGVIEIYTGYQSNPEDNVAHFAHIGGMIFGFILVQIYKRSRNNFY